MLIPRLAASHRPVQLAGMTGAALLAALILIPLWGEVTDSGCYRFPAVVVIITALLSLIIPLPARMKSAATGSSVPGGLYQDKAGALYEVKPVSSSQDG
jgi:hypothetical protein